MNLIAFQAQPPLQREGLPYWLFWFLLCIILLLLAFIFLRDKKLRMRLSSTLAGPRRRSILLQLKFQIKRESQKRADLWRQLGERVWDEDLPIAGGDSIQADLTALHEKKSAGQMEWKKAYADVEALHQELERSISAHQAQDREQKAAKQPFDELMRRREQEGGALSGSQRVSERGELAADAQREKEEIRRKIDEFKDRIKEIKAEGKRERHEIERELHHWERRKERLQERIKSIEAQQAELYISLGRLVENSRVEGLGLGGLYAEIESANHRILTLEHRIETLTGV